jgi:hypothetical protein
MWLAWERGGKCTRFWCESTEERDHLEDQVADWRIRSELILGRLVGRYRVDPAGSG